jgi:hypothetical protein
MMARGGVLPILRGIVKVIGWLAGCWLLVAGCWLRLRLAGLLVAGWLGCWVLASSVAGCWVLARFASFPLLLLVAGCFVDRR